jgi:carbonyl reductase 1
MLTQSLEEGARIPVRLAVGDIGEISGKFWENQSLADTGYGEVAAW